LSSESNIQQVVGPMVKEAYSLLGKTIDLIRVEDERKTAAKSGAPRHRLLVLLDATEQTQKRLPKVAVNPWFIAELKATLEVIRKWKTEPIWKEIEPSLVNSSTFTHTIVMLQLAEHLRHEGHPVELIPTSLSPTPDLRIRAIGGTQEWFRVEFYQPSALNGFGGDLTEEQIDKIVKKVREKASAQIGNEMGVIAVCGYNQSKTNILRLRKAFETWLQRTSRVNLGGVILEILSVLFRKGEGNLSFQPTIRVEYVANPNYFGNVGISEKPVGNKPNLISEPLHDIRTEEILKGIYAPFPSSAEPPSASRQNKFVVRKHLSTLGEHGDDRAIMEAKIEALPFFFKGEGNIDYMCGNCGRLLVEKTWELSLSNIVLKCPGCESNNSIPMVAEPNNPKFNRIGIAEGRYKMESSVELRRGVQLVGIRMGKEKLHLMIEKAKNGKTSNSAFDSVLRKTGLGSVENPSPS
jgi:hypothetical protein